jgi:hypothetical protein
MVPEATIRMASVLILINKFISLIALYEEVQAKTQNGS